MSFPELVSVWVLWSTLTPDLVRAAGDLPGAPPSAAAVRNPPAFRGPGVSLSASDPLSPGGAAAREISPYCRQLLGVFGQRYGSCVGCLVPAARPVTVCQSCFSSYGSLADVYHNISHQLGPGNESCADVLLHSDRLMLIDLLFSSMKDIWTLSSCDNCITLGYHSLTNDTVAFLATLNQTLTCFDKNQQGNQTELCKNCKGIYGDLNKLYSKFDKSQTLCIDMEDSMNTTRRLWSKSFNCSVPREETVPVIAVSSFMLFLPIIFYLSSFLHSEQKKRKLIHPKRAKSYNSLVNIQEKLR